MKFVLSTALITCSIFVWLMMHFTSMGYQGWGIFLVIASGLGGIMVGTDRS